MACRFTRIVSKSAGLSIVVPMPIVTIHFLFNLQLALTHGIDEGLLGFQFFNILSKACQTDEQGNKNE